VGEEGRRERCKSKRKKLTISLEDLMQLGIFKNL